MKVNVTVSEKLNSNTTRCFERLGCFDNNSPFEEIGLFGENDPALINTEFLLFTNSDQDQGHSLSYSDHDSIKNSKFNPNLPLKIVIHGYANDLNSKWMRQMKDEFFKNDDFNVILVGWGKGALYQKYNIAAANTRIVGKELSTILNQLEDEFSKFRTHCIGHGLGAHTCSYAANGSITFLDRVTALDPANLYFENAFYKVRVNPSVAKIVDVIHTDIGEMVENNGSFGMKKPTGTVDVYVNGGKNQPGCPTVEASAPLNPNTDKGCNHNRAITYFIESINSFCPFTAFQCNSWDDYLNGKCIQCGKGGCTVVGYYADDFKVFGSFYVATSESPPFCGSNYFAEFNFSPTTLNSQGILNLVLDNDNNPQTIEFTTIETDIRQNSRFTKLFVSTKDLYQTKNNQLSFTKKPYDGFLAWLDKNSKIVKYSKIKLTNLDINEIYSECVDARGMETDKSITSNLKKGDC